MLEASDFIERGYFPKELPPLFSASHFAANLQRFIGVDPPQRNSADLVRYSHSKYASTRRELAIPHPCHYLQLVKALVANWEEMEQLWAASNLSKSKPIESERRAVEGEWGFRDLPEFRAEVRAAGRYLFHADITSFYHSVYTHSIPWAIHGKRAAKANRSTRPSPRNPNVLWGNVVDLWSRNLQDGQTIGLPVGPDTSFVISETILCSIDQVLQEEFRAIRGFRFIDDYEFVCSTQPEAERVLAVLQETLSRYELRLNPRKTFIRELPEPLDTPWVEGLGAFELENNTETSKRLVRYFTRAFELARRFPGDPVLKYAIRRLESLEVDEETAILLQRLLLQAASVEPGTIYFALRFFSEHKNTDIPIDTDNLQSALNQLVQRHSALGHGSEVAWCIWAATVFEVQLDNNASEAIARMEDDVVALTAMFSHDYGVFVTPPRRSTWQAMVNNNSSVREHWLLTYEAVGKGWLAPPTSGDLTEAGTFMQRLRSLEIEFVNPETPLDIPSEGVEVPY